MTTASQSNNRRHPGEALWGRTLQKFLGHSRVMDEEHFSEIERSMIEATKFSVCDTSVMERLKPLVSAAHLQKDGAEFYYVHRDRDKRLILIKNGSPIGGSAMGTTWVSPDFRGLGYGALIVRAAYSDPSRTFLSPSHYSANGFLARIRAHADEVCAAFELGLPVPNDVLDSILDRNGAKELLNNWPRRIRYRPQVAESQPVIA